MSLASKLFGLLMLVLGLSLVIYPSFIFGWFEGNMENSSLYVIAIVVRVALGILFILSAKESKFPGAIKFFGYLFLIAAIILILIGKTNFFHFIQSMIPGFKPYAPFVGILSMAFGGFIVYAFRRRKEVI